MSKISDMIEAAGARASAVSPMHAELLEHLESRLAALEANSHVPVDFTPMLDRIAALEALNVPRAKATPAPKLPDPAPEPAAEEG